MLRTTATTSMASETAEQKGAVLRERGAAPAHDISGHGGAGQEQAGKVEDGVDPVSPAGDEAVKGAEGIARPGVEAALLREARGELVDDQRAGDEEEDSGDAPRG